MPDSLDDEIADSCQSGGDRQGQYPCCQDELECFWIEFVFAVNGYGTTRDSRAEGMGSADGGTDVLGD